MTNQVEKIKRHIPLKFVKENLKTEVNPYGVDFYNLTKEVIGSEFEVMDIVLSTAEQMNEVELNDAFSFVFSYSTGRDTLMKAFCQMKKHWGIDDDVQASAKKHVLSKVPKMEYAVAMWLVNIKVMMDNGDYWDVWESNKSKRMSGKTERKRAKQMLVSACKVIHGASQGSC